MNSVDPQVRPLSGIPLLKRLIAAHLLLIVALAISLRFEAPGWISVVLLVSSIGLVAATALCAGRTTNDVYALMPAHMRPRTPPRDVGVLALVLLGALTWACARWVYPQSWPTSVNDAVAAARASLDENTVRSMSYMNYDELAGLQNTLGARFRERFGLTRHNTTLLHACDPDYRNARSCSMLILSRVWRQIRAQMSENERIALEQIESRLERVRFKTEKFNDITLNDLVAFLNDAIRAQSDPSSAFAILTDPHAANERVTIAWYAMGTVSLREVLEVLVDSGKWRLRKEPPHLIIAKRESA